MTVDVLLLLIFPSSSVCKTSTQCTFTVEKQSAEYLAKWLKLTDGMLAHLEFNFDKKTFNATDDVLFPNQWMWTFVPPGGGRFYISWPVDYYVYSFGLLDTNSLKRKVTLYLKTRPANCTILFGSNDTIQAISNALYNMSVHYLFKLSDFYEYSYWCYIVTNSKFLDRKWYNLNRYLGVPLQLYGYRCCRNYNEKHKAICDVENMDIWNPYQLLPFYIGIIFFVYFPVTLAKIGKHSAAAGKSIVQLPNGFVEISAGDSEFLFLKRKGPISLPTLLFGIFGLADKHPYIASRVRRTIFVCFTPIVVYIFILIYHISGQDLILETVRHKIPSGFVTMLGGLTESLDLFLPLCGGPVISLALYIVIGLIVILIPRDLAEVIELGLPPDNQQFSTLLRVDVATIEQFSKKNCQNLRGYRKVYCVMRGSVYMLINPQFWCSVASFHVKRWASITIVLLPCCIGNRFSILVRLPLLIIYISICILETALFYTYHGLPICPFIVYTIHGYARYIQRRHRRKTVMSYILASVVFPVFLLFFVFMIVMVVLQSFTIIGYFIFFLYLSVIIFPSRAFGFVYFIIMFILFVHGVMKDFETEYQDLLVYSIKASIKLSKVNIAKELLKRKTSDFNECLIMEFLALTKTTHNEIKHDSFLIQSNNNIDYVKYRRQVPGIPKELFQYVVNAIRPVHIAFFHMVIQIICVQIVVLASIIFISTYIKDIASRESSEVLNVMSVIVVSMLPNIFRLLFIHVHNKKVRKRKVRQRVIEFWEKEENYENGSD